MALIYDDLLKTMQHSALRKILHHTFILPESGKTDALRMGHEKIALIVFSYFEDLLEETLQYIKNMPEGSDIFIVVVTDQMKELWKLRQKELSAWQVYVRKQQNRGRNEAAYWLTCRDAIENHDIICVAHDKKTPSARPGIKGYYFSRHCWDGILKSRDYVQNLLALFRREPQIGLLMPPPPLFSDWASLIIGNEWGNNRELAENLYKRLDLHVPFDETPAAPFGTMFWVRRQAMRPFFRYPWTVEDFPREPLKKVDGTVLHALERMYPMIAQEAGYCSGWVMPASYGGVMYDNLSFGLEQREAMLHGKEEMHFRQIKDMLKAYGKRKLSSLFQKS